MNRELLRTGSRLALAAALLLAGCASPYSFSEKVAPRYRLASAEAVRLAAQAMQSAGYFATSQDERAGFVIGERHGRDSFEADMLTLYLEVRFTPAPTGELQMIATCTVSKNIVYTDELDDECEKFRAAFAQALERRTQAPPPVAAPRPAPEPPPAAQPRRMPEPPPAPAPPAHKEFSL